MNVRVSYSPWLKVLKFLTTALVRCRGSIENGRGSIYDRSLMWIGPRLIAGVPGFGDRGSFWAFDKLQRSFLKFSEKELDFSEKPDVLTIISASLFFWISFRTKWSRGWTIFSSWIWRWIKDNISIRKEIVSYRFTRFTGKGWFQFL